jgi:MerR family transcriptional regulator, copper efflux regulator
MGGSRSLRIGELARLSGVPARTIRYYEAIGLLPCPERDANGYRRYDEATLDRLAFVKRAKEFGFTLEAIKDILDASAAGRCPCEDVRILALQQIARLDDEISRLLDLHERLTGLLHGPEPGATSPDEICPIILRAATGAPAA